MSLHVKKREHQPHLNRTAYIGYRYWDITNGKLVAPRKTGLRAACGEWSAGLNKAWCQSGENCPSGVRCYCGLYAFTHLSRAQDNDYFHPGKYIKRTYGSFDGSIVIGTVLLLGERHHYSYGIIKSKYAAIASFLRPPSDDDDSYTKLAKRYRVPLVDQADLVSASADVLAKRYPKMNLVNGR